MTRALLIPLVASLIITAPARAEYPGQRPVASPTLNRMVKAGVRFWERQGIRADAICPSGVALWIADDLSDTDIAADNSALAATVEGRGGGCGLVLRAETVSATLRSLHRGHSRFWAKANASDLAETTWHELGHAYGLLHTDPRDHAVHFDAQITPSAAGLSPLRGRAAWLMDADVSWTPPGCDRLARQLAHDSGVNRRAARARRRAQR